MNEFNKNYETIKTYLFTKVVKEEVSQVIEKIEAHCSLSIKEINEVLSVLHEDKDIVIADDIIYIIDGIHYRVGNLRIIRGQFGFVGEKDNSVYIAKEQFYTALDHDEVLVEVIHAKEASGKIIYVLKREREFMLGTMVKDKGQLVFKPYSQNVVSPVSFDNNGKKLSEGDRVIAKIVNVSIKEIELRMQSILGKVDEPGIDVLSVLFEHDLDTEFDPSVIQAAEVVPQEVSEDDYIGRIDHRNQYAITIDGEDAKDLDDAIYLETSNNGYRLYVHIADVSHYVEEGTPIDVSAYARTSSIYMVDRVVPMLPKELSNGICSLNPNVDRLVITCKMDIDFDGNIYHYDVYPSVIQSKRRMSYNEINNNDDFGDVTEMIHQMLACAEVLQNKRNIAGAIEFDSDESQFIVDAEGKILDIFPRVQQEAEKMIESFMVSANESVANYCKNLEIPILYRVHEKPDLDKMKALSHTLLILGYRLRGNLSDVYPKMMQKALQHFEGEDASQVVSKLILRSMKKARYAPEPLGHFGLALQDYTHFTAPIRRYSDLLLHRHLHKYVFNHNFEEYDIDSKKVDESADHVSTKERDIMEAEREVEKIKKAEYMKDKIHESYPGIISGFSNYGIFVQLPNTVEGVIPLKTLNDDYYVLDQATQRLVGERTKKMYSLGDRLEIVVDSVDEVDSEVVFKMKQKRKFKKKRGPHYGAKRRKK